MKRLVIVLLAAFSFVPVADANCDSDFRRHNQLVDQHNSIVARRKEVRKAESSSPELCEEVRLLKRLNGEIDVLLERVRACPNVATPAKRHQARKTIEEGHVKGCDMLDEALRNSVDMYRSREMKNIQPAHAYKLQHVSSKSPISPELAKCLRPMDDFLGWLKANQQYKLLQDDAVKFSRQDYTPWSEADSRDAMSEAAKGAADIAKQLAAARSKNEKLANEKKRSALELESFRIEEILIEAGLRNLTAVESYSRCLIDNNLASKQ